MSQLAQCSASVESVDGHPVVLQYPVVARRLASFEFDDHAAPRQSPVARARLEHHNRCCRNCRRATVEPIELEDALLDRRGLTIPGTATVVGFYCRSCGHEWAPHQLRVVAAAE
jgi:hypothetical protein